MAENQPADTEVLNVMRDGANRICDYAIEQWISGKYTSSYSPEEAQRMIQENYQRWQQIRQRAGEIVNELKREKKSK